MTRGPDKQFDPKEALEKAMHLFWANGYAATGMAELQAAMGIGRKSLYDTFGNKRQLFIKVLEHYTSTVAEQVRQGLNREGSPVANIRRVMRHIEQANSQSGSCGCLFGVGMAQCDVSDAEMTAIFRGHLKIMEDTFYRAFKKAQDAGEIGDRTNLRDLARLFMSTIQGLALIGRVTEGGAMPKSVISAALSTLETA